MPLKLPEAQINKELAQYENDLSWVLENYDSLIKRYGNKFVAVLNQTVLGQAATIEELCKELRTKHNEDFHRIVIEFIYTEHPNFVLGHASYM